MAKSSGRYSWQRYSMSVGLSANIHSTFTIGNNVLQLLSTIPKYKLFIYTACTKELWKVFVSA